MKIFTLLMMMLALLIAGTAIATEKLPDTVDAQAVPGSRAVITGTLNENSPTWNRGFNNVDPPDPTCNFPLTDSSDGQFYDVFCIRSTNDEAIEVVVDADLTTVGDTHMELYCDPFDPGNPLENAVFSDDDDGDGLMSAFVLSDNLVLTPGTEYWLVLTTFSPGDTGDFTIVTSDNVLECGGVGTKAESWSGLKDSYR